jgi:hypothetical protein
MYMEGGIDVLDHVGHIGILLVDKFINGSKLWLERPVSQFLHLSPLDLVDRQKLTVMLLVGLEETSLTDESSRQVAVSANADIKDIFAVVTLKQTFGSHRPLHFRHLTAHSFRLVRRAYSG